MLQLSTEKLVTRIKCDAAHSAAACWAGASPLESAAAALLAAVLGRPCQRQGVELDLAR